MKKINLKELQNLPTLVDMENFSFSLNILEPGNHTAGQLFPRLSGVYYFVDGYGEIALNNKEYPIEEDDIIFVEKNIFHKIYNTSNEKLKFLGVFEKYGGRRK